MCFYVFAFSSFPGNEGASVTNVMFWDCSVRGSGQAGPQQDSTQMLVCTVFMVYSSCVEEALWYQGMQTIVAYVNIGKRAA